MSTMVRSLLADTSRYAAGVLLLLAAGLNWLSPSYTDATFFAVTNGPLHSVFLLAECLLGVSLLGRLLGGVEVILAAVAYAGFSTLNLWNGVSGAHTCGCFGSLRVNPWVMFAVDASLTTGLILNVFLPRPTFRVRWRWAAAVGVVFVVAAGLARTGTAQQLRASLGGPAVYLDPRTIDLGEHPAGTKVDVSARLHNRSSGSVRVVGLEQTGFAEAGPGLVQVIEPGAVGELPLTYTVRGKPGRRLAHNVLYCESDGRLLLLALTVNWTVAGE